MFILLSLRGDRWVHFESSFHLLVLFRSRSCSLWLYFLSCILRLLIIFNSSLQGGASYLNESAKNVSNDSWFSCYLMTRFKESVSYLDIWSKLETYIFGTKGGTSFFFSISSAFSFPSQGWMRIYLMPPYPPSLILGFLCKRDFKKDWI